MSWGRSAPRVRQVDEPNPGAELSRAASLHKGSYLGTTIRGAKPKEAPIQHAGYMRMVAHFPCANCGIEGYTQFCHGDQRKGMGLKADCRTGWPGCGPRPSQQGCHYLIGTAGTWDKEERRQLEELLGRRTRDLVRQRGLWPSTLR